MAAGNDQAALRTAKNSGSSAEGPRGEVNKKKDVALINIQPSILVELIQLQSVIDYDAMAEDNELEKYVTICVVSSRLQLLFASFPLKPRNLLHQ